MSYSQAIDAQMDLLHWYTTGNGGQEMATLFRGAVEENRMATAGTQTPEFSDWFRSMMVGVNGGTPVYWSPEMCSMLESVAVGMPAWTLRPEAIPDTSGFIWFSKPLAMPMWPTEGERALRAIGFLVRPEGLFLSFWGVSPKWERPFPSAASVWELNSTWGRMVDTPSEMGVSVQSPDREEMLGRYCAAAFALMEQRIIVSTTERPARASRKRAADIWRHEPFIRVVQLRRTASQPHGEHSGEPVEWSCQWVVRGHWRQQAVGPERSERRPIFVLPHIKGPTDKPLKAPAERVFAVTR